MKKFLYKILEALFDISKEGPDECPDLEYKNSFTLKYYPKKVALKFIGSALLIGFFATVWFIANPNSQLIFAILIVLSVIIIILTLHSFCYRCVITEESLKRIVFFVMRKTVYWSNVSSIKKFEHQGEKAVRFEIYNKTARCVLTFNSSMENAWYIIKMAEEKGIPIKQDK